MGILLICENCNWEIIPMLLIAWLLGILFWAAFFRRRHKKMVTALKSELEELHKNVEIDKRDLEAVRYKNQKLTDKLVTEKKQIKSLEMQLERLQKDS